MTADLPDSTPEAPTVPLTPPPLFLEAAATQLHLEFDDGDLQRLGLYLARLLATNTKFNLTAVKDPEEAWTRHVLDALTLVPLLVSLEAKRVIDVGSGGGLPGIPLAAVMPETHFTLLEATGKKARFLEETVAALGLTNVDVVADRAETIGQDHKNHREQYDVALVRAVGPLAVIAELSVPLVRVGGCVLAIKGERAREEIKQAAVALKSLHGEVIETQRTGTGTIVVIQKTAKTPRLYPRRPGEPKRVPLGGKR